MNHPFQILGVLAAALLCFQAQAQTPAAETPAESEPDTEVIKIYDENTLKPADIRACLKSDQDIDRQEEQLAEYEATVAKFKNQIEDLADELDERRKEIDGTDAKAVDAYNKKVDRHRTMIDRYNEKFLPTLAQRRARLNEAIDFYNANCAGKAYFEDDWLAAVSEMGIEDPRPQAGGGK